MKTELEVLPSKPKIDYELLLDCVHCGLCTASCPTYVETGNEADSPRGRIYLMRQVIDETLELDATVKGHIDKCLNCRACETACPSGVQYGKLIEPFKEYMEQVEPGRSTQPLTGLQRWMLFNIFPSRLKTRLALAPARAMQWSGLDWLIEKIGLTKLLPKSLRTMKGMLPPLRSHYGSLPEVLPAIGPKRARVGLFLGCVADAIYPRTNYATAKVLQMNGCEVVIPKAQGCCGALHYHSADETTAQGLAALNASVFPADLDAIITNAAGCGAMLKDYSHLMHNHPKRVEAEAFQAKIKDISEFLYSLGPITPKHPVKLKATYHDACHLRHAQQIQKQPRSILEIIPGLELVPLGESELCCGAAGSYNLTQPEMAGQLGDRKVQNVKATGASAVLMGNVGCLMQVSRHLKKDLPEVWAAHPIDILYAAYTGEMPPELR
ncbi:MAG: (Fe-S)-binding protein [Fimbriiglobus sp.]